MKKQTITSFIILLYSLFLAIKGYSQTKMHDSLIYLQIKGKITNLVVNQMTLIKLS